MPLVRGGITAAMALIIRLEVDRDDQNLSYAATIRQGSRGEHTWRIVRADLVRCGWQQETVAVLISFTLWL